MKILAYGGNEYAIRTVIGEWPGISSEYLGDLYGIPAGSPSFGLVFPGGSPALLYRERINPQYRGGYPYTVLLDLGPWQGSDTLWSRAGWNAAGLLESMFGLKSPRRAGFMAPENLSATRLIAIVEEILAKGELDQFARSTSELAAFEKKWASFVAGSLDSTVPEIAPPRALSLDRRPTMAQMASLSAALPLWIRTGRGWMVGGSYTQAAGFGAGALLDDEPFAEKADPSAVLTRGEQLQLLLGEMSTSPLTAKTARELTDTPAIAWPDLKQFVERARLWHRAAAGDDSAFQQKLPQDGVLAAEIFDAAIQNARDKAARQVRIGPNQTRAILESRTRIGPTRIAQSLARSLDQDALNKQLEVESVPPNIPAYLDLAPELCLERSKKQLDALNGELSKSDLEKWRRFLREAGAADKEFEFLKDFVWRQHRLWRWKSSEDRKLNEILKQEAAFRLQEGPANYRPTWLFDILYFLPEDEANQGVEKFKNKLDAPLKDLVLQLQAEEPELGRPARRWLTELAASDLRKDLSVETKLEIAFVSPSGWTNLLALSRSLREGKPFPGKEVAKPEREVLAQECVELLRLYLKGNQLQLQEREFRNIAKVLDLEKRQPDEWKSLSRNTQLRRYLEAPEPARKSVAIDSFAADRSSAALPDLLAEAGKLSAAMAQFANAMAAPERKFTLGAKVRNDPGPYNDLADLLFFERLRGRSALARFQTEYTQLPRELTAVWQGLAGLLIAAAAWYLRFHQSPIPWAGGLGAGQHHLALTLAGVAFAIAGAVQLFRGAAPRSYLAPFSEKTSGRLQKCVRNFLTEDDRYTIGRCRELIEGIAQSGPRGFEAGGSFDWLLLLYLGSDENNISQFEENGPQQRTRVRRSIVFILAAAGLIKKKGWLGE
jgi:hypothetical protein